MPLSMSQISRPPLVGRKPVRKAQKKKVSLFFFLQKKVSLFLFLFQKSLFVFLLKKKPYHYVSKKKPLSLQYTNNGFFILQTPNINKFIIKFVSIIHHFILLYQPILNPNLLFCSRDNLNPNPNPNSFVGYLIPISFNLLRILYFSCFPCFFVVILFLWDKAANHFQPWQIGQNFQVNFCN
jgi:hypothetical protein